MSMDSTTNSVDIDGLDSNVEYQFQVVAIIIVSPLITAIGERSEVNDDSLHVLTSPPATIPNSTSEETEAKCKGYNFFMQALNLITILLYRLQ